LTIISIFCPYCLKYTSLTAAQQRVETGNGIYVIVAVRWERDRGDFWWIGITNCCQSAVLAHNDGDVIYPSPLPSPTDKRIPESIRQDLEEAKMCFSVNAYRACAVMARRAMQSACIEKGTTKDKLFDQLTELALNGVITKELKEWADVVRWVGNDSAHPNAEKVTKEDAEDILKLAEQFLHVLYVTPAIAKERRTLRGK
jgi:HEPN domain-containing protein